MIDWNKPIEGRASFMGAWKPARRICSDKLNPFGEPNVVLIEYLSSGSLVEDIVTVNDQGVFAGTHLVRNKPEEPKKVKFWTVTHINPNSNQIGSFTYGYDPNFKVNQKLASGCVVVNIVEGEAALVA